MATLARQGLLSRRSDLGVCLGAIAARGQIGRTLIMIGLLRRQRLGVILALRAQMNREA